MVDAGNLWQAAEAGVLAAVRSAVLEQEVPAHLRDPQGRWYGLSVRARTLVYQTDRILPKDLSTYEDLAYSRWKGRLCLSSSGRVSNRSLVASLVHRLGEDATERVVRGWVANLAVAPFADDSEVLEGLAAGLCDVGLVNSYYYGRYAETQEGSKLAIFWPNQQTSGVQVNVSGAGVTAHAKHPKAALRLLEWLAAPEAQGIFASLNMEYPANPLIAPAPAVAAWGAFKPDPLNTAELGRFQSRAVALMDRAGYR
jgi:iron(III) transport system substrate-binding protein